MSRKKQRLEQALRSPGAGVSFSQDLVSAARWLLFLALEQRKQEVYRLVNNHYSSLSPGSIALLAVAFESWLNELVLLQSPFLTEEPLKEENVRELLSRPTIEKYQLIPQFFRGKTLEVPDDLEILIDVRNEIVHHMPRAIPGHRGVPTWFADLDKHDLLFDPGPNANYPLAWKFSSYRLAFWAWDTIDHAARNLVQVLHTGGAYQIHCPFGTHRQICSPERLNEYDKLNNLQTTRLSS